ncbi:MAG: tRNA 2-selenouridine(34) synthase MnmH [Planctomycetota bacterium]|nr:MAG: tRNA 2-selenouridine(34) synthase MnmH [Planctomycetota bacterium]
MSVLSSPGTTVPVTTFERLAQAGDALVIDMRSPGEFAADHVPGAHNVPLFEDVDRAVVGLLYHRASREQAFARGRSIVLARIDALVARVAELADWSRSDADLERLAGRMTAGGIEQLERELTTFELEALPERPVVVHCWRGGLRSRSMIVLLRALGLDRAIGLAGGYKSYRRHVRETIETWRAPSAFVLRGLTGVGKTLVLRELERLRPRTTLDLEGMAGHRSSLLGMVGLEPCTQKTFESRIFQRIGVGFPGHVVLEGESRKVGDRIVPASVWDALTSGVNIELRAPMERRVQVLVDDYLARESNRPELRAQLAIVEARMEQRAPLVELFDAGREQELVRVLLERYYDPLYRHSEQGQHYALTVDATDPTRAAAEIAAWIHRIRVRRRLSRPDRSTHPGRPRG